MSWQLEQYSNKDVEVRPAEQYKNRKRISLHDTYYGQQSAIKNILTSSSPASSSPASSSPVFYPPSSSSFPHHLSGHDVTVGSSSKKPHLRVVPSNDHHHHISNQRSKAEVSSNLTYCFRDWIRQSERIYDSFNVTIYYFDFKKS